MPKTFDVNIRSIENMFYFIAAVERIDTFHDNKLFNFVNIFSPQQETD